MLCKNRITPIGFLGQDAESRSTPNGTAYTRLSLTTNVNWKEKGIVSLSVAESSDSRAT